MKFKRYITMFLTIIATIIVTISNTFTRELLLPEISLWAIGILNEGKKYGIYPITWYYDDFQQPIIQDTLQTLIENTSTKIATLGMEENANFVDYIITAGI